MRKALLALLVVVPLQAHAQQKNAVYFEIGGSAVVASINYERRLGRQVFGRAGLMTVEGESDDDVDRTAVVPLSISWLSHPQSNHHFELGGGLTIVGGDRQDLFWNDDDGETFSSGFGTAIIGYRFQKPHRGFQFRAALTPLVGHGEFQPWAGFSFGYSW